MPFHEYQKIEVIQVKQVNTMIPLHPSYIHNRGLNWENSKILRVNIWALFTLLLRKLSVWQVWEMKRSPGQIGSSIDK